MENLGSGSDGRGRCRRWLRRLAWVFAIGGLVGLLAYLGRVPLLTGMATMWIVDDSPKPADAIVVLGGGIAQRPFEAAKLYHEGLAPRVLYMDVKPSPVEVLGLSLSERELTRRVLLTNGVPESALEAIGSGVASTYDESCAVREWMKRTGARSVIITTDWFHTRRARWIFRHELRDENPKIQMVAAPLLNYTPTNWWQNEEGVIAFENEIFKFAYYRLKY